jgi:hypothetical protein
MSTCKVYIWTEHATERALLWVECKRSFDRAQWLSTGTNRIQFLTIVVLWITEINEWIGMPCQVGFTCAVGNITKYMYLPGYCRAKIWRQQNNTLVLEVPFAFNNKSKITELYCLCFVVHGWHDLISCLAIQFSWDGLYWIMVAFVNQGSWDGDWPIEPKRLEKKMNRSDSWARREKSTALTDRAKKELDNRSDSST